MKACSVSDYQLRETRRGWQVVIPRIRGGKVRGYETYSPVYRDKAQAEACLQARLESARAFAAYVNGLVSIMGKAEREIARLEDKAQRMRDDEGKGAS